MGIRTNEKWVNYSHGPTQTRQQVSQCIIRAPLVYGQAMGKHGLTRLTMAQIWGKPLVSPL
jgi:hypothetical protein